MTIGDRIKEVRKLQNLTMAKFGERIKISNVSVSRIESGINNPSDQTILLICREFNINETWLREGSGDMFKTNDNSADIARLTSQLLNEDSDSFKNCFISMLSQLNSDEWKVLEKCASELYRLSSQKGQ